MPTNPSDDRIPCKNPECGNKILPVTAKANDGLCGPCLNRTRAAAREEYIRQNRRTVNLYEDINDPVEAISIMLARRPHDPLIQYLPSPKTLEEWFNELSPAQVEKLAGIAAKAMQDGDKDLAKDLGRSLAILTEQNLDSMLLAWIAADHLWPSIAFRSAGGGVRDRILARIGGDMVKVNHQLCALAWIGDEIVQKQFAAWERQPPAWRQNLHVGPAQYAQTAGWELFGDGRRNLFHEECFGLAVAGEGATASGVRLVVERPNVCPWCGDHLVHLIEIPKAPEFTFLGFSGEALSVLTCERCTCWEGPTFARIEADGQTVWHLANQRRDSGRKIPSFEMERGPWADVAVVLNPRNAIRAADWLMETAATQIGGLPRWVQDTEFPVCPDCSRTMMFVAQVSNDDFRGYEGNYYAFWCRGCRVTATCYQQT